MLTSRILLKVSFVRPLLSLFSLSDRPKAREDSIDNDTALSHAVLEDCHDMRYPNPRVREEAR